MKIYPSIEGECPACGKELLFVADGGNVTCSVADCPKPDAASLALKAGPKNQPHLQYETSERGFISLPDIPSSNAEHPHIWLNAVAPKNLNNPTGDTVTAPLHLTVENAKALAEQLLFLVDEHYQGSDDDEYDEDECPGHKTVCDDDCGINGCGCCGCDDE
jgi:hypothetical protein